MAENDENRYTRIMRLEDEIFEILDKLKIIRELKRELSTIEP